MTPVYENRRIKDNEKMRLRDKLMAYFEESGVVKKKFAKKVGVSHTHFYQVLHGKEHQLAPKCWEKVIDQSHQFIKLADLVREKFKDNSYIIVVESDDPKECKILIKENL